MAYLSVVAGMAAADGEFADEEFVQIRRLCFKLGLTAIGVEAVLSCTEEVDPERIQYFVNFLSSSELRFALLADLLFMAHADAMVTPEEEDMVLDLSVRMNINARQLEAIRSYVEAAVGYKSEKCSKKEWMTKKSWVVNELLSTGVSAGAMSLAGEGADCGISAVEFMSEGLRANLVGLKNLSLLFRH